MERRDRSAWLYSSALRAVLTPAMWQVLNGEKTAAAAMAEIRPVAQALIDDMFNQ